jgi:hypothetical protein
VKCLTLQACAVRIVRDFPQLEDGEQVERIKQLAVKRGIAWQYGGQITDALERAKRYEPKLDSGGRPHALWRSLWGHD